MASVVKADRAGIDILNRVNLSTRVKAFLITSWVFVYDFSIDWYERLSAWERKKSTFIRRVAFSEHMRLEMLTCCIMFQGADKVDWTSEELETLNKYVEACFFDTICYILRIPATTIEFFGRID